MTTNPVDAQNREFFADLHDARKFRHTAGDRHCPEELVGERPQ